VHSVRSGWSGVESSGARRFQKAETAGSQPTALPCGRRAAVSKAAYGTTDELGFKSEENGVSIHDLQGTVLHALGVDHRKLTYRYASCDFRFTDVCRDVFKDVLA